MSQEQKAEFGSELLIDVNPGYDWATDDDQPELANPVHVNNKLIVLANALVRVTQGITRVQRSIAQKKKVQRELADAVRVIEEQVLKQKPPTQTQIKTLKAQQAYISAMAHVLGLAEPLSIATKKLATLEDEIEDLEMKLKNARNWVEAIKIEGEHIKSFLSYYKHEQKTSRYGT